MLGSTAVVERETHIRDLFSDADVGGMITEVPAGTIVFEQGQSAEHVYYIERGQVRIYQLGPDGTGRLVEIMGPGQWFGCSAFAAGGHYCTRAVAVGSATLIKAQATRLLPAMQRRPDLAVEIIRHLATTVQSAVEDAGRLVFDDCNSRLIKTLVRFSRSAAATPGNEGVVLRITHEQLAQAVGVARETVSLALTEMRHQNLVRTGRNQLIFNPDVLQKFASTGRTELTAEVSEVA